MNNHRIHILDWIAIVLVIIGGINWLLVGLFTFDLVAETLGRAAFVLARIIYIVVGIAAVYLAFRAPTLLHYRPETRATPVTR